MAIYTTPDTTTSTAPVGYARVSPVKSAASIVAILAAIGSFFLTFRDHEGWAILAAVVAMGAGLIGMAKAVSPRVSGGILSFSAIGIGVLALIVAIIGILV